MEKGPFFILPMGRGGLPFLTSSQADDILLPEEKKVSISVFDAYEFVGPCSESKMSLTNFFGLPNYESIMTLRSAFQGWHCSGPSSDQSVSGEHEKGRVVVSLDKWLNVKKIIQPKWAISMYDSASLHEASQKKRRTSSARTDKWSQQAVSMEKDTKVIIPSSSNLEGDFYYIDFCGQNENILDFSQLIRRFAANKKSTMCTVPSLPHIISAISCGATFIESQLPFFLAESGIALTFPIQGNDTKNYGPQIDLNDPVFQLDIRPLYETCTCYTCRRHTRAYIHHLLTVQEMNSNILLVIHNVHHLIQLFRICRNASPDKLQSLLNIPLSCF